jgi:hypothetical protein
MSENNIDKELKNYTGKDPLILQQKKIVEKIKSGEKPRSSQAYKDAYDATVKKYQKDIDSGKQSIGYVRRLATFNGDKAEKEFFKSNKLRQKKAKGDIVANINEQVNKVMNNAPPVTEARIQLEREAKARRDKEDARRQTELDKEKDMTREPDTNLYRFQKQKRTNKDNDLKEINDSYNRNLKKIQMQFEANGMSVDELNKEIIELTNFRDARIKDINNLYDPPRDSRAEGSLMVPEEGMPVDTYPNVSTDEEIMEVESQLSDNEMETNYQDFILSEALDSKEQNYLTDALEADPKLGQIFDKVVDTASEFSGSGEVEGPGTGLTDSIPARLSAGEFVMTKKATDAIGPDNLQAMMDEAERIGDSGSRMKVAFGGAIEDDDDLEDSKKDYLSKTDEEIRKVMIGANKMPSVR